MTFVGAIYPVGFATDCCGRTLAPLASVSNPFMLRVTSKFLKRKVLFVDVEEIWQPLKLSRSEVDDFSYNVYGIARLPKWSAPMFIDGGDIGDPPCCAAENDGAGDWPILNLCSVSSSESSLIRTSY